MKKSISDSKSLFLLILVVIFGFSGFALAIPGDLNGDDYVNLTDLSLFADQWLADDCISPDWCDGTDINHSGNVDFNDFAFLAQNWMTTAFIWSDEFNGTTVDLSKWVILNEADGADSWYLPANVTVSGGTLKIANKEESAPNGGHWTGGHIDALYHPQYKYLEARVRHSAPDIYIWATWWTVGWTGSTWVWPPEMDICEVQGGPGKSPGQTYWYNYAGSGNINDSSVNTGLDESQWHTYGVYWNATNAPVFYVDRIISGAPVSPCEGNLMAAKLKLTSSPNSGDRVHGCPLGNMEVDYVRVYDAPPAQPAPTQHLALNKPVTTSSAKNSGGAAERAVDESSSVTRWESNWYDPQWIRVDLQATCSITQVKLNWQYAAGRNYKIQVSDEPNGPWTDCISVTNYTYGWLTHNFAAKTGRYIQLLGTARTTAYGYSLYDMQVYGTVIDPNPPAPPTRTNLALGKTATCSSSESGSYPASMAVDGNLATRWSSLFSDPQWICVDLGATYTIDTVKLYWETSAGKEYTIQTAPADSPNSWTTRATVINGSYGLKIHEFTPVSCRYVRMYGTVRTWQYGYSLYEMEVY